MIVNHCSHHLLSGYYYAFDYDDVEAIRMSDGATTQNSSLPGLCTVLVVLATVRRKIPPHRASHRRISHERVPRGHASHGHAPHGLAPREHVSYGRALHRLAPHRHAPHKRVLWACTSVSISQMCIS
jgi:hypothetical protein